MKKSFIMKFPMSSVVLLFSAKFILQVSPVTEITFHAFPEDMLLTWSFF